MCSYCYEVLTVWGDGRQVRPLYDHVACTSSINMLHFSVYYTNIVPIE